MTQGTLKPPTPATGPAPRSATATAVVGLQWGDEGKGKLVDLLAAEHDLVVRYNGGANAGHSVVVGSERYALHLVPSGILYPGKLAVIGNGVCVDPEALLGELEGLQKRGVDTSGLVLSSRAHVVMPYHKKEDELRELALEKAGAGGAGAERSLAIGTTKRGIGPCYAEKAGRATAVRVGDLLRPDVLSEKVTAACKLKNVLMEALSGEPGPFDPEQLVRQMTAAGKKLAPMIQDTTYLLHDALGAGKRVLFEGGNATLLDLDHGTFPYVTSSNCSLLGIGPGTGVPTDRIRRVVGVMKTYSTRVGHGPFPTELSGDLAHRIRERGREYGTTTGRPRRVGWLDLVAVRYSVMVNGVTELALMMTDVLAGIDEIRVCTAYRTPGGRTERYLPDAAELEGVEPEYETLPGYQQDVESARSMDDLPAEARRFIEFIERQTGVPVAVASVGPGREQTILK